MTHICVLRSHKPIRIYMGGLILGVNTLYMLFCFFKLFPMVGKGLRVKPVLCPKWIGTYHNLVKAELFI